MIKGCCTVLLLLIGLMGPSLCAANSSKNAQVSHLELFFSQIMSVDEYRNYKNLKELNR
ncbi:MAG: peptidase M28, partial [Acinetobacter sp.]